MLDRSNLKELQQESDFKRSQQNIKGANFIITGDITHIGGAVIKLTHRNRAAHALINRLAGRANLRGLNSLPPLRGLHLFHFMD